MRNGDFSRQISAAAAALSLISCASAQQGDSAAADNPAAVVESHLEALAESNLAAFTAVIGSELSMFNCPAGSPEAWEPHLYFSGESIQEWASFYVMQAGPHEGVFEIASVKTSETMAIVATKGTGSNKFRSWADEETVWLLGMTEAGWRISGFCLDMAAPGEPNE